MAYDWDRFKNLTFDGFRKLALDDSLSCFEKTGFPNSYREGKEEFIFADIRRKLRNLDRPGGMVVDIGPGCSGLASMLLDLCEQNHHHLVLIDSVEMLSHLPDKPFIEKRTGPFPQNCRSLIEEYAHKVDAILTYSVIQYVFVEANIFDFVDQSLVLLADGGELLIGDIPNISKRKRFLSSPAGVRFHQEFTGTPTVPDVSFNRIETGHIDDATVLSVLLRCRNAGFDAHILPQEKDLPMANRREDLLIRRP